MNKEGCIALLGTLFIVFGFFTVVVVQTQQTTRTKVGAGYVEQYVPYTNVHVWTKP